ncbi:hypothetical protein OESDEN_14736 [Oesophagostomum dentatum]|uniref:Transposase n=1 Tax=Oesophagostomum dentatum TaxID=61180 RepID=A0A0B1SQQ2_OESDE|nr:hypothetical protein OESDEN_14736 [Oesophagostomum dentatum]
MKNGSSSPTCIGKHGGSVSESKRRTFQRRISTPKRLWFPFGGTSEVVYCQLLDDGATITANLYMQQLRAVKAKVDKSGGFVGKIYFQHGNARPHIARDVKLELCKFGWNILPHPPFSPISRRQTTGFLRI